MNDQKPTFGNGSPWRQIAHATLVDRKSRISGQVLRTGGGDAIEHSALSPSDAARQNPVHRWSAARGHRHRYPCCSCGCRRGVALQARWDWNDAPLSQVPASTNFPSVCSARHWRDRSQPASVSGRHRCGWRPACRYRRRAREKSSVTGLGATLYDDAANRFARPLCSTGQAVLATLNWNSAGVPPQDSCRPGRSGPRYPAVCLPGYRHRCCKPTQRSPCRPAEVPSAVACFACTSSSTCVPVVLNCRLSHAPSGELRHINFLDRRAAGGSRTNSFGCDQSHPTIARPA